VIATGGFESNREWRTRYLGPAWSFLRPRGTRFNQGLGLAMALEIGAQPAGHWSGCHSSAMDWDAITRTPEGQNLPIKAGPWHRAGMYNSRLSYIAGIQVNARGERFVDEGEEWMPFTYVKVGARVAEQPDSTAWQLFDARAASLLTGESLLDNFGYDDAPRVIAGSVAELAQQLGIPCLTQTVEAFNASIPASQNDWPPDFSILDGQGTIGIDPPKSNWARRLDTPPFSAFKVTTGITFSFGGLKINTSAEVLDTEGRVIPGLYAAGNSVGLWYYNYPGGGAVTAGATFGRIAGAHAAGR
jgi:tricarballylate dehydrogenase